MSTALTRLRLLFWLAVAGAFVMAILPQPPQLPTAPSDKVQHIAAFVVLSLLGTISYPRLPLSRLGAVLSAFGVLIEAVQLIPALHRDGNLGDWVTDTVAIAVTLSLVGVWRSRRRTR